jgi:hypothetical protein
MIAAMGLDHTSELRPHHVVRRVSQTQALAFDEMYPLLEDGELIAGSGPDRFQRFWDQSRAESFRPGTAVTTA